MFVENQDFTLFCFSLLWCHQESNRGHKDFQNSANRYNCLLIRVVVIDILFVVLLWDYIFIGLFQRFF